jgi:hypothetical protein
MADFCKSDSEHSSYIKCEVIFTGCWWENLRERSDWGDPDVDGSIILNRISGNWRGLWGLDRVGSG